MYIFLGEDKYLQQLEPFHFASGSKIPMEDNVPVGYCVGNKNRGP
jgi:hypothetical protein